MSMSKREGETQSDLWIPTTELAQSPGHPFYERLNKILAGAGFDAFVEKLSAPFYAKKNGRPSIAPGIYVRILMVGYFEGLRSEREIDWRCADSLSLRAFLGYDLSKNTPDHSTLCRIRQRLDLETHREVFTFVLKVLAEKGLLKGKTLGIDTSTLEASAAMKSMVRRDGGEATTPSSSRWRRSRGSRLRRAQISRASTRSARRRLPTTTGRTRTTPTPRSPSSRTAALTSPTRSNTPSTSTAAR